MEDGQVNTPGLGGYLLAYVLADLVFTVLTCVVLRAQGDGLDLLGYSLTDFGTAMFFYVGFLGIPIGLLMIPAVHFTCRGSESQVPHVAAAGLAGFVGIGLAAWWYTDGVGVEAVAYWLGAVSTAVARLLVIPSVRRRRRPDHVPLMKRPSRLV